MRNRILALCAPILLSVVAICQNILATTGDLTAWKGGGFGMFATVDSGTTRTLHSAIILRDGTVLEGSPYGFDDLNAYEPQASRAKSFPDNKSLSSLATKAAHAYQMSVDDPSIDSDDAVAVRVEVRSVAMDASKREMRSTLIRTIEVPVP